MDYWILVFIGIAVWRLTKFLYSERGPRDLMLRFRTKLAQRQRRAGGLFDLFSCFYCLSIWVSVIPSLFISHGVIGFFAHVLILSGIAILVQDANSRINKL